MSISPVYFLPVGNRILCRIITLIIMVIIHEQKNNNFKYIVFYIMYISIPFIFSSSYSYLQFYIYEFIQSRYTAKRKMKIFLCAWSMVYTDYDYACLERMIRQRHTPSHS